ncbi:hypothetical protein QBC36DRAFT_343137 [Triangularia setosa]|uniref:Uncharacterized protein n=1 Tax=Triangularia setosa TaxID=2587417 RepID=A0AAN7AAM0_9PEZI|nr:hypothetical protein QBC36DRAFT_343137 [Podospora setosa]
MVHKSPRLAAKASATPIFPFNKLPQELQDKVWKSSDEINTLWRPWGQVQTWLELGRGPTYSDQEMISPKDKNGKWLAKSRFELFVSRHILTLAHICHNSRQIIKAQASLPQGISREYLERLYGGVIVFEEIYAENKQLLLPILPKDNYLALELPYDHRKGLTHKPAQGRRPLEYYKLSNTLSDERLAAKAKFWHNGLLLHEYCRSAGEMWPFVESVLEGQKARDAMVEGAIEPLMSLWNRENKHREDRGLEKLKPLPTIDVVAQVWFTHSSAGYGRIALGRGGWD